MNPIKVIVSALALTIMFSAIIFPLQADAAEPKSFADVSINNVYYDIIHDMRNQNIISGYEDGTFRPSEVITRKHAAALINRARDLQAVKPFVKFNDVSEQNAYFNDIKKLQTAGIFEADSKGNFYPNQPITRAEMAKVLALAFKLEAKAFYDFPDVPSSHSANPYVRAIYSNGITTGDNGYFNPNGSLTRAHYAVFMYRALHVDTNYVPQPVPQPKPVPVKRPNYTEFAEQIKTNPLFMKGLETNAFSYYQLYNNTVFNEGQQLLKGTNYKYIRAVGAIRFAYDGYVNKLDSNYPLLSIDAWEKDVKIRWDFRDKLASEKAAAFLELLIPGLGLTEEIITKSEVARRSEITGERFIGNREIRKVGDYVFWIGVAGSYQFGDLDFSHKSEYMEQLYKDLKGE